MPNPLIVAIHPDDLVAGVALIGAAADTVCPPQGGVVAAWDYAGLSPLAEDSVDPLLRAATVRLSRPRSCFGLRSAQIHLPGLVPSAWPAAPPLARSPFAQLVVDLAHEVDANGALGLIVSMGSNAIEVQPPPPFSPGILHILPLHGALAVAFHEHDAFAVAGFPTLTFSRRASRLSAHEILDCCGQLAARMAEDLSRSRAPLGA